VKWQVSFHDDFAPEFDALAEDVQDEMLAHAKLLEQFWATTRQTASGHIHWFPSCEYEGTEI